MSFMKKAAFPLFQKSYQYLVRDREFIRSSTPLGQTFRSVLDGLVEKVISENFKEDSVVNDWLNFLEEVPNTQALFQLIHEQNNRNDLYQLEFFVYIKGQVHYIHEEACYEVTKDINMMFKAREHDKNLSDMLPLIRSVMEDEGLRFSNINVDMEIKERSLIKFS